MLQLVSTAFRSLFWPILICLFFLQCKKENDTPTIPKSSAKGLTNPIIDGITSASATYDAVTTTYTVIVPFGTDITALKISFTLPTGATAKPASGSVQNFTNPVTYTVTAEDGGTQMYTVKVTVSAAPKSSEKQITAFTFAALSPVISASIDQSTRKITATFPSTVSLNGLAPTITLSSKATVSPASGLVQNFTNPVNYTVTAEDGTSQTYTVTAIKASVDSDADALVYIGSYAYYNFTAVDATTGSEKWHFHMDGPVVSSPTVSNGVVYVGSDDKKLYAFDAANGAKKWEFLTGNAVRSSPTVSNGVVYIASYDNKIYAIEAVTGTKKWEFTTEGVFGSGLAGVISSPIVNNGVVYIGSYFKKVYALDAATGTKKWEFNTGDAIQSSPTVSNGVVYIASNDYKVYALDAATGNKKWEFATRSNIASSPIESNGIVYIGASGVVGSNGSANSGLYALDAATGVQKWVFVTAYMYSTPTISNGIVYAGASNGYLWAIDATTGTKKWEFDTGYKISYTSPVVSNGTVYMANDQYLYAFNAATGTKKWTSSATIQTTQSSPCVVTKNGTVIRWGNRNQ